MAEQKKKTRKLSSKFESVVAEEDRKVFLEYLTNPATKVVIRAIIETLDRDVDSNITTNDKANKYDNASWPYLQADGVGFRRALRQVKQLLESKTNE